MKKKIIIGVIIIAIAAVLWVGYKAYNMYEQKQPDYVDRHFAEAISSGNVKGAMALFDPSAIFVDAQGNEHHGIASIGAFLQKMVEGKDKVRVVSTNAYMAGDTGLLLTEFTSTAPDGMVVTWHSTSVLREKKGSVWNYVIVVRK